MFISMHLRIYHNQWHYLTRIINYFIQLGFYALLPKSFAVWSPGEEGSTACSRVLESQHVAPCWGGHWAMGMRHTIASRTAECRRGPVLWHRRGWWKIHPQCGALLRITTALRRPRRRQQQVLLTTIASREGPVEGSTDLPLDSRDTNTSSL